jgi:hypothetical protein
MRESNTKPNQKERRRKKDGRVGCQYSGLGRENGRGTYALDVLFVGTFVLSIPLEMTTVLMVVTPPP